MKNAFPGLPILYLDLLVGMILVFLLLVTTLQFNRHLATRQESGKHGNMEVEERRRLQEANAALEKELAGIEAQINPFHTPNAPAPALTQQIARLDQEIVRLRRDHAGIPAAEKELQRLERNKQQLQARLAGQKPPEHEAQLAALQHQLADLTARDKRLEQRLQALRQENSTLAQTIRQKDLELAKPLAGRAERQRLQENHARLSQAARGLEAAEQAQKELLATQEGHDAHMTQLRKQILHLARNNLPDAPEEASLLERLRQNEDAIARLREKQQRLTAQKRPSTETDGSSPSESVAQELSHLKEQARQQEQETGALRDHNDALRQQLQTLQADLALLSQPAHPADRAAQSALERELDELQWQILRREGQIQQLQKENHLLATAKNTDALADALRKQQARLLEQLLQRDNALTQLKRQQATPGMVKP